MKSKYQLPKVSTKYGAPMGRPNERIVGKCHLWRVELCQGYDNGGAYWGNGDPLFCAKDSEGSLFFVRAACREKAKVLILDDMFSDDVTFYK